MGSLRRPDGVSRLVVVQGSSTNALRLLRDIELLVLPHPGIADEPPPPRVGRQKFFSISEFFVPASLRGGKIDPNDPSHVTFDFVVHDFDVNFKLSGVRAKGTVDAYLENDDSLRFNLREDPEQSLRGVQLLQDTLRGSPIDPPRFQGR